METMSQTGQKISIRHVENNILNINNLIYMIFVGIVAYMAWCTPLTHDDIKISKLGINIPEICEFMNGRFLANLLSLLFCRYESIRIIGKAGVLLAIVILIKKITEFDTLEELILCMLLILYPSRNIFAESYTWTAGFTVYVPATLLSLLVIFIVTKVKVKGGKRIILVGVIFCLTFVANICVEHGTVLNVCLCLGYAGWLIKNTRKIDLFTICAIIGNILGAFVIFFAPMMLGISSKVNQYRKVYVGFEQIKLMCSNILTITRFFSGSFLLFSVLSGSFLYILYIKKININRIIRFVMVLFPIYSIILGNITNEYGWSFRHAYFYHILYLILFGAYLISIIYIIYKVNFKYHVQMQVAFWSGIFVFVELCFVSPIGGRTLYLPYVCWLLMTMFIIREIAEQKSCCQNARYTIYACGMVFCLMFIMRFSCIRQIATVREVYLEQCLEQGKREVILPTANVSGYIYCDSVDTKNHNVNVIMVPWEVWCDNR